ncbi:hypothetical protein Y032_0221g2535 [Ancylostoma ceylanicum]|uniref:Uncharacterized protein n=1 Tax=Ancylostoma ceylanicum TaxID=53326 RepID=A0A016SIX9_9BILA|nr:hypothetical protein Y032_0221g2535 [Ancylostoma ceylanicum]
MNDDATVHCREAKTLRDAAAMAITEVWTDARTATSNLARKTNEGNSELLNNLNESSSAEGSRIDSLPMVATYSPDEPTPKIVPFSGSGEDLSQFPMAPPLGGHNEDPCFTNDISAKGKLLEYTRRNLLSSL